MTKLIDITGQRFHRLIVVSRAPNSKSGQASWNCMCDCGTPKVCLGQNLKSGRIKSCGCFSRDAASAKFSTHGKSGSVEFGTWVRMKSRCGNPKSKDFNNYGGRGIRVCQRWLSSFSAFFDDMGPRPSPRHTIERINNDGDYEPSNCCWATRSAQMRNNRHTHYVDYMGKRMAMTEATEMARCGVAPSTVRARLKRGWSVKDAVETPVKPLNSSG